MTTTTMDKRVSRAAGSYGFRGVTQMEWRKLRSVRSTWWTLAVFAAGMVGLAVLVGAQGAGSSRPVLRPHRERVRGPGDRAARARHPRRAGAEHRVHQRVDPRHVRRRAAPRLGAGRQGGRDRRGGPGRGGGPGVRGRSPSARRPCRTPTSHAALGQPGVLRAVLMAGAYPALIALIGLGLAALIRHTAGAISAIVGVVFVLPLILLPLGQHNAVDEVPADDDRGELADRGQAGRALAVGGGRARPCSACTRRSRSRQAGGRWRAETPDRETIDDYGEHPAGGGRAAPRPVHPPGSPRTVLLRGRRDHGRSRVLPWSWLTARARRLPSRHRSSATVVGLLMLVVAAIRSPAGSARCTARLLRWATGDRVPAPAPFRPGTGLLGRLDRRLRDSRRAGGPSATPGSSCRSRSPRGTPSPRSAIGLADIAYPLVWVLFRNHPAGTKLGPLIALFPVPYGHLAIETWPGTLLAVLLGVVCVIAGVWLARGIAVVDARLVRALLGPGRVSELERTRAIAVEDAAAALRRVERDLHDGAQVRLAAVAMNLGMAQDKADDVTLRELLDAAQTGVGGALADLRRIARGIHPPVLDYGLADALDLAGRVQPDPGAGARRRCRSARRRRSRRSLISAPPSCLPTPSSTARPT